MLEKEFEKLYYKFRANYCKNLFSMINDGEGSLSPTESYCLEAIFLLDRPSIRDFAAYTKISMPNATYRISNLVDKGFVRKVPSVKDRRECNLEVTNKFMEFYGGNTNFNTNLMNQIKENFSLDEVLILERMIKKIVDDILE